MPLNRGLVPWLEGRAHRGAPCGWKGTAPLWVPLWEIFQDVLLAINKQSAECCVKRSLHWWGENGNACLASLARMQTRYCRGTQRPLTGACRLRCRWGRRGGRPSRFYIFECFLFVFSVALQKYLFWKKQKGDEKGTGTNASCSVGDTWRCGSTSDAVSQGRRAGASLAPS